MARKSVDYLETLAADFDLDILRLGRQYASLSKKISKTCREIDVACETGGTPTLAQCAKLSNSSELTRMCHKRLVMAAHIAELAIDAARMRETAREASTRGWWDINFRRTFSAIFGREF